MGLEGQVAIVTGGGRGLGRGICLCLAEDGADVIVADINIEVAQQTAADVAAMGRKSLALKLDVTKSDEVQAMVKKVLDTFGRIDILVNNAGIVGAPGWLEAERPRLVDWDLAYEVNLKGVVICSEAVAPHLKEKRSGRIVNISSVGGRRGVPGIAHYSASKAGCISYTQSIAQILGPYNITVNAICPGTISTPLMGEFRTSKFAQFGRNIDPAASQAEISQAVARSSVSTRPLGREQTPEDIGYAVCFFVSDRAKNITAQTLNVDGGAVMN